MVAFRETKLKKVKKSNGQVFAINWISEKNPTKIKDNGIWVRYQSRTGYHNMYTEMASRHRVRHPCIKIIKTATIPSLPRIARGRAPTSSHGVFKNIRPPTRKLKTAYKATRPNLFI